jgi:hypothetical protein
MSGMEGLAEAYARLLDSAPPEEWANSMDVVQSRAFERWELLHKAFCAQAQRVIDGANGEPPATSQQSSILDVIRDGGHRKVDDIAELNRERAAAGGRKVEERGESYEDWVALAEEVDRKPTDFIRKWMADVGGWDRSSAEDRVQQYQKAQAWYASQQDGGREAGEIDTSRCPRCGSEGDEKQRRSDGHTFYVCTNQRCGFQGDDGWVSTKWDDENWLDKREQVERMKNGGGRGRSGGGRPSGNRGRSYAGRR